MKLSLVLFLASAVSLASARWGFGIGGMGHGGGGHGGGGDMHQGEMMDLIHDLIDNRKLITREKKNTDAGIQSHTYSEDEQVASWIQTHVEQMMSLMESDNGRIRAWDDLFAELFDRRDMHALANVVNTTNSDGTARGVSLEQVVTDQGIDDFDCMKALIQSHAEVVSKFVSRGRKEMHNNHLIPDVCDA